MPLRAFLNGIEIISLDYSDHQWSELKNTLRSGKAKVVLPCCDDPGFLRVSRKGLKHFVHSKSQNNCQWKPETPEHLKAKVEIVKACQEQGWKAIPEFCEGDWRADVLAVKDGMRIAFEVQWSKQTMEETKLRQQRYKNSNVRGCWFFRTPPKTFKYDSSILTDKETPSFKISKDDKGEILVTAANKSIPVKYFVEQLLHRNIKFCENYSLQPKQEVEIVVFDTICWKCKKPQQSYTVDQHLKSICNEDMYMIGSMWNSDDIDKNPAIVAEVMKIIESESNIVIGAIKRRFSKTIYDSYLSYGCYYCDAIFGDFYLNTEKLDGLNSSTKRSFKRLLDLGACKQEGRHWCHSETKDFCE